MKAIYTDAAKRELEAFQSRQQQMMESVVADRKLVPGDEILEITASDIKAAARRIQVSRRGALTAQAKVELLMRAYIVIGVVIMVGSLFKSQLIALYASDRYLAWIFIMGAAMAAIGWVFNSWFQARRKRIIDELADLSLTRNQTPDTIDIVIANQREA